MRAARTRGTPREQASVMRFTVLVLVSMLAGCLADDTEAPPEGDHLVVHVSSAIAFDQLLVDIGTRVSDHHVYAFATPQTGYLYQESWAIGGQGAHDVRIVALATDGTQLASGELHGFLYDAQGDGTSLADLGLALH